MATDYQKEFDSLVSIVIDEGVSDLHFSPSNYPIVRVAGELIPLVKKKILTAEDVEGFLEVILPADRRKEFSEKKDTDFSYATKEDYRFRCNAYHHRRGIAITLRLIPPVIKSLEELSLPKELEYFSRLQQGFFLVVGPVGHGKSTTLAALVNMINKERAEHIITIEDPIEFIYKEERSVINQREVGFDTPDFRSALHSMFREDVDVVLIGEMRDPDTISTSVTAGETGHLVFSTLHTNNAPQTIDRIIDSFPADQQNQIRAQLSQSLAGVFSQRLVPRISGGLIPAYELLINNYAVANLIREGRTHELNVVLETGIDEGMIDMNRTLADLVRRGEITSATAQAYAPNAHSLENFLRG